MKNLDLQYQKKDNQCQNYDPIGLLAETKNLQNLNASLKKNLLHLLYYGAEDVLAKADWLRSLAPILMRFIVL
jgi:hypothetical protein